VCTQSRKKEISAVTLSCRSKKRERWSSPIFIKENRYSPDSLELLLRIDTLSQTAFVAYRISNDSSASIRVAAFDAYSGKSIFVTSVQPNSDDVHLYDMAIDESHVYLCGSAQSLFQNLTLGLLIKLEKSSGELRTQNYLGRSAFRSVTRFRKIHLVANKINLTVDSEYKWLITFDKKESTQWLINKIAL
jgi:hypothetical protein